MSVGQAVRRVLGAYEPLIARRYRRLFLDTDALADAIAAHTSGPRILEIGCGEGLVAASLLRRLPDAHVTGIDTAPTPGRLFGGNPERVRFVSGPAELLLVNERGSFDLVVVSDVLHHVPDDAIDALLDTAAQLCAEGGVLAVKEWERNLTAGYRAGWFSDRVISGQRVRFFDRTSLMALVEGVAPATLLAEVRVRPRHSNLLVMWRLSGGDRPDRHSLGPSTRQTVPN